MRLAIAFLFVMRCAMSCGGYDAASHCARSARTSRRTPAAPCDLTREPYCSSAGTHYPWKAIKNFIRENQGLMRRMYGEERHITILKAELENFVEDESDDIRSDLEEDIIKTKMMYSHKSQGRAMTTRPHFRPIKDKNKKVINDTLLVKPLPDNNNLKVNKTKANNKTEIDNNETLDEGESISYKTKLESIANIEINDLEPNVITLEAVIKQSIETNRIYPKLSSNTKSNQETNTSSGNGISSTTTTEPTDTETTTEGEYEPTTLLGKDELKTEVKNDTSTLPPTLLFSVHEKIDRIDTNVKKKDEIVQKPSSHQDRPSVIKLQGHNACDVHVDLVAPFWANNTNHEQLALVNMYPFEQFIHMEKCTAEFKQMYCREGCRCEQQYRVHRLLAYDPNNDCRGIFADWFLFPACCVCKCYDVPVEFRTRAPRVLPPQYGERVRRLIYEDAALDWSRATFDDEQEDLP